MGEVKLKDTMSINAERWRGGEGRRRGSNGGEASAHVGAQKRWDRWLNRCHIDRLSKEKIHLPQSVKDTLTLSMRLG